MAHLPAKQHFDKYEAMLTDKVKDIARIIPNGDAQKAARFITACKLAAARNPAILQCTADSKLRAAFACAVLDLVPDVAGQGYFVPYGKELAFIVGYQGMVELAHRSGHVAKIDAELVYDGDEFRLTKGTHADIVHNPNWRESREPEDKADLSCEALNIIGAYAVCTFKSGAQKFEFMNAAELNATRNRSRARSGPWHQWPDVCEMYRKCPVRRLSKMIPQSPDLHLAIEMDNAAEKGVPQIIDVTPPAAGDSELSESPESPDPDELPIEDVDRVVTAEMAAMAEQKKGGCPECGGALRLSSDGLKCELCGWTP